MKNKTAIGVIAALAVVGVIAVAVVMSSNNSKAPATSSRSTMSKT